MKLFTKTLAAFAALVLAQSAMAQTNVYVTGSTAFRAAVESLFGAGTAAESGLTQTIFDSPPAVASVGTAVGSSFVNYTGTIGGASVRVKVAFTGSAGGIYLVAHNGDATPPKTFFLPDGAANNTTNATPTGANGGDLHTSDIAFSDAYQLSSFFPTPTVPTDTLVGVVTFKWVGNWNMKQGLANVTNVTNITSQQIQALYGGPELISVAAITGGTATNDKTTFIFPFGRDLDSGTRITAFADSDNGTTTSPNQWQPFMNNTSSAGGTNNWVGTPAGSPKADDGTGTVGDFFVSQIRQWNAASGFTTGQGYLLYNNNLSVGPHDGGFNSGGDLAKVLRCDTSSLVSFYNSNLKGPGAGKLRYRSTVTGAYSIGYLGIADAATALNATTGNGTVGKGPGVELAYNGVSYSTQNVQSGAYSMWGFEHLLTNEDPGSGSAIATVYNSVSSAVLNNADTTQGGAGLLLSSLQVTRSTDGSAITATYY